MRLTTVILIASLMQVSAAGLAQKISLSKSNASLKTVLREIKTKTGYNFIYRDRVLEKAKPVTISVNHTEVEEVLKQIFENQELSYSIDSKTVIIQPKEPSFLDNLVARFRAIDVSGRVVDEKGIPLPGATVKVKDGKGGAITDSQGRFLIENVSEGSKIIISFTGYVPYEVVAKQNIGMIMLKLSENPLDQVQIIAYGTTSRRLSTSNTVTVGAKEIENQPVNNPLLALQGRVPGMTITPASGVPGAGITVRIQGRNNLDNSLVGSDPLIVIDGVPYVSQNLKTFKGGGRVPILGSSSNDGFGTANTYGNPLSYINPSDIESITILKDADGTAIYGSRAANGAILITTKKGKAGDIKTDFNLQRGAGVVAKKLDLLTSQQYMEMRHEGKANDNEPIYTTDYDLRGVWDTTRYTDWQKELIGGSAEFTRLTAGVSGGTNNLQFLVGSTYGRETSVFPGDFANTFGSLHFNVAATSPNQRFKIQLGGNYMVNNNKLPGEDYTSHSLNIPPVAPSLYNSDGTLNWAPDPQTGSSTWFNPLARKYNLFETKTNNLISSGNLSYRIATGLELKSTFGYTSTTSDQFSAALDESEMPENRYNRERSAVFSFNTRHSWIAEPQLTYQLGWRGHQFGILIGTTFQSQTNNGRAFTVGGQSSDLTLRNMLAGTAIAGDVDINEYKYNAIFGRLSYSYRDKYLINLSSRRDGSSRFGSNSKFNDFGAIGLGWILSSEEFFRNNLPFISFAKLRGSYGITGNDQIGNYRFLNLYNTYTRSLPYQGESALKPTGLPNSNLEWEETRKLQFGLDLGIWKDRLLLSVAYSRNRSSNSLTSSQVPIITGFNTLVQNLPASIQNTSSEFSLSSVNVKSGDLRWTSNLNFTVPRNKLLAFPGIETSPLRQFMTIGKPLSIGKTFPFYDVDPLTGLYRITNHDGVPTSNAEQIDRTFFMDTTPRWYGGFQNSFSYKRFSLDFLVQIFKQFGIDVLQLGVYPGYFSASGSGFSYVYGNQPADVMSRWQKPGDMVKYQRFSSTADIAGVYSGSLVFQDVSYVRLKNVSFSYQIPVKLLEKVKMEQLRLYANAQNLFTLTSYKGLDPETLSISSLPSLRVITVGLQATF